MKLVLETIGYIFSAEGAIATRDFKARYTSDAAALMNLESATTNTPFPNHPEVQNMYAAYADVVRWEHALDKSSLQYMDVLIQLDRRY